MTKLWSLLPLFAIWSSGCTTIALEKYTLSQIHSIGDLRDAEVMNCLAAVAADPNALPAFAVVSDGTTKVQDQYTLSPTTTWTRAVQGFSSQTLLGNFSRNPSGTWTLDPIADFERLEAMRCACQWVLGIEGACGEQCDILDDPREKMDGKPHFGVRKRLERIRAGWIHSGRLTDVPHCARYKAHCGSTWVWVLPEDAEAFAQFTLVLLDIASLDGGILYSPRLIAYVFREKTTKIPDPNDPKKVEVVTVTETRAIKPEKRAEIEAAVQKGIGTGRVELTYAQWMDFTTPYHGVRSSVSQAGSLALPSATAQPTLFSPSSPSRFPPQMVEPKSLLLQ